MDNEGIIKLEQQIISTTGRNYRTIRVGNFLIQTLYYSVDRDGHIWYDTETMNEDFGRMMMELDELNNESRFDFNNVDDITDFKD